MGEGGGIPFPIMGQGYTQNVVEVSLIVIVSYSRVHIIICNNIDIIMIVLQNK